MVLAALTLTGVAVRPLAADAAELVMVEQAGCPYCERFDREIAPAWPNTDEGRAAPLRRVDLHDDWPADLAAVERTDLTPTFILVEDGVERGRLVGYRGDEHFWFLVGELLERLDAPTAGNAPAAGDDAAPRPTER